MSYGTNAPQGFQSYGTQTAASFTGQTTQYAIASGYNTSIFTGDPVILKNGVLNPVTDGSTVKLLSAMPVGIFLGCEWQSPDPNIWGLAKSPYWPANTVLKNPALPAMAWVIVDPNATWNIQVSTAADAAADTATVKADQVGLYATWGIKKEGETLQPPNPGKGNTSTGQSGVYLDASSIKADPVGLPLVILGLTPMPGNKPGIPFNNVLVGWNPKIVKPSA
jgi:hypothetical protein